MGEKVFYPLQQWGILYVLGSVTSSNILSYKETNPETDAMSCCLDCDKWNIKWGSLLHLLAPVSVTQTKKWLMPLGFGSVAGFLVAWLCFLSSFPVQTLFAPLQNKSTLLLLHFLSFQCLEFSWLEVEGTSPLGFQATDHSWRLYFNICKRHTTGYFKDTLGQFLAVFLVTEQSGFTETSWHVQNALCWPDQIFIVKTWSFPNPIHGVFVPKSNQTTRTALSKHKSVVCKNLHCEHLLWIGVLDYLTLSMSVKFTC